MPPPLVLPFEPDPLAAPDPDAALAGLAGLAGPLDAWVAAGLAAGLRNWLIGCVPPFPDGACAGVLAD